MASGRAPPPSWSGGGGSSKTATTAPSFLFSSSIMLLLVVVSLTTAAYAWSNDDGYDDTNATTTSTSAAGADGVDGAADLNVVPWPGSAWLTALASKSSEPFEHDGISYGTAYDALTYGESIASNPYRNFNSYVNSFFFGPSVAAWFVTTFGVEGGHYAFCYVRNLVAAMVVYYGTAGFFHYHCYVHPRSKEIYSNRKRPSNDVIWDQIQLAQASMFVYVGLPVLSDWLVEEGYTQCYYTLEEIGGWIPYALYLVLYFTLVEIGIYWMHRTLHTNKTLYKHVHMLHHKYNKPDTLTPWASIAFHPLDGILQASPYVFWLPFVPCHYLTHIVLVFFTAIWATYIHDAMDWNVDPIMGSKYHTVHHTHYVYNYGQVFTFCDRFWGTLRVPVGKTGVTEGPLKVRLVNPSGDQKRKIR